MAGKRKIIEGLSDIAQRWFDSLGETTGHRPDLLAEWPEFVEKVKNVDKELPSAFSQYEPRVLRSALAEAANPDSGSDVAVISPEDFRMLAARNLEMWMQGGKNFSPDDPITQDIYRKINEYADMYEHGIQFDDIPRLEVSQPAKGILQVVDHNGRHRTFALGKIGADGALIRVLRPKDDNIKDSGGMLHTELSSHQSAESGGGKAYKPVSDVLKFLSLGGTAGALGNLVEEE